MQITKSKTSDGSAEKGGSLMSCDYEYAIGRCFALSVPEKLAMAEKHLKNALKNCQNGSERAGDVTLELGNIKRQEIRQFCCLN